MESLTLTAAIARPSITAWKIIRLNLEWQGLDGAHIQVSVQSPENVVSTYRYTGAQAATLITSLNKANLSIKSLQRRVLEQLAIDFPELAGTITGSPD